MAVAIEMKFPGATVAQYDQTQTDDGLHIVDVWESREKYDQYAADYIGPYSAEVGMTEPPELRFYDVHNYLTRA